MFSDLLWLIGIRIAMAIVTGNVTVFDTKHAPIIPYSKFQPEFKDSCHNWNSFQLDRCIQQSSAIKIYDAFFVTNSWNKLKLNQDASWSQYFAVFKHLIHSLCWYNFAMFTSERIFTWRSVAIIRQQLQSFDFKYSQLQWKWSPRFAENLRKRGYKTKLCDS